MDKIFFDDWNSIIRSTILTILAYIGMIIILRISGKRTLSKMNAYDFIVTIALGSSMATVALTKDVTLADGILVFGLFALLQYTVTRLSINVKHIRNIVTNRPALLLYKGEVIKSSMKKERITLDEIYAAARKHGFSDLQNIDAIILESTGTLTVVKQAELTSETLKDVDKTRLP